jgi:uncharacterized protein YraI
MKRALTQWTFSLLAALMLALFLTLTPALANTQGASRPLVATPFQATVTAYSNVRVGSTTQAKILRVASPGTQVTVYAQVSGQSLWAGSTWDRISAPSASAEFIYGGLLKPAATGGSGGGSGSSGGQFQGTVTSSANVRTGPSTSATIKYVARAGTVVTVYAQVTGSSAWAGNLWDRISPTSSAPLYIYSALVQQNGGTAPPPSASGKVIVVYISRQWLYAYDNGRQVFDTAVTTAQPGLVTPVGTYTIFSHKHPTTFYSPWPPGSPYYYPPTYINYAMGWRTGGYYLHDSSWRSVFGPGTNVPHQDPKFGWETGTHGCVTAALDAIIWLYNWAPNGTTFIVKP